MPTSLSIRRADLENPFDQQAIVELLDMYAREPMGGGTPLADDVRKRLIPSLRELSNCRVFLALIAEQPVGMALCFMGFSSFRAMPLLNVHDLAVVPQFRGQGIGRALLRAVEEDGRAMGCCRLTLEVRSDNLSARHLYESVGFTPGDIESDAMLFWKKDLK